MHRLLLLLFTLLWSTLAQADSTLRLVSDRPVIIVVNLVPYTIGVDAPRHVVFEGRKHLGRGSARAHAMLNGGVRAHLRSGRWVFHPRPSHP